MSARTSDIKTYNPVYDLVRGLASILVFIGHLKPAFEALTGKQMIWKVLDLFLIFGVEFFFALSGLLLGPNLYRVFLGSEIRQNIKTFMLRRWYRTLPTYYIGFILFVVTFLYLDIAIPDNWPLYLFFLQNLIVSNEYFYSVAWSLSVEEIFYILFPALTAIVFLMIRAPSHAFLVSLLIIVSFSLCMRFTQLQDFTSFDSEIRKGSLLRLDSIAIGAIIGIYYPKLNAKNITALLLSLLAIIFGLELAVNGVEQLSFYRIWAQLFITLTPVWCATLILYFINKNLLKPQSWITILADISYPLYIFHLAFIYLFFTPALIVSPLRLILCVVCTIVVSYAFFKYVETPILKKRPKYLR